MSEKSGTGSLSVTADDTTTVGSTTTQSLISAQITAREGCMAESDASGTQAMMVDDSGCQNVVSREAHLGSDTLLSREHGKDNRLISEVNFIFIYIYI